MFIRDFARVLTRLPSEVSIDFIGNIFVHKMVLMSNISVVKKLVRVFAVLNIVWLL